MSDILIGSAYTPAEAERGKFTVIDDTYLQTLGYPTSGTKYGRYAVLTYNVGGGATPSNPVFVVQSGTNAITVSTVSFSNSLSTITFSPAIAFLEIYNGDSSNKAYITFESSVTTVATLTARGLPINAQGYYSIEKSVSQIKVGSNTSISDFRVFGHSVQ